MSTGTRRRTAIVPAASERRDGWTTSRQAAFLRALASTHSVKQAARSVGMSRQSAYRLRARLREQPFDLAWEAAFQSAFDRLAEAAMDRAVNGVEVPHFHKGDLVYVSRRFDERLTVALLSMREAFLRPEAPPTRDAATYEPGDFHGLLHRVETGGETWEDEPDLSTDWPEDEDEPPLLPGKGETEG